MLSRSFFKHSALFSSNEAPKKLLTLGDLASEMMIQQEYILWNTVSVPLLQFVGYCCGDIKPQMFWVSTLTFQGHVNIRLVLCGYLYVFY